MGFFSTLGGAAIGGADAQQAMQLLKLKLQQQAVENDQKQQELEIRKQESGARIAGEQQRQAGEQQQSDIRGVELQMPGADLTNSPAALGQAQRLGMLNVTPAQSAVAAQPAAQSTAQLSATLPDATGTAASGPMPAPAIPAVAEQTAKPSQSLYTGTPTQQLAQQSLKARQTMVDDPATPASVKAFARANPNQPIPYELLTNDATNQMRQTIADNKNETAKQLEDLKREHSRETTALQLQLMQAKIDELHRKGDAPAPVGIDSATKQTASGQKYVDGSMFHGKDYTAAQQEATAKGVHFLSKDGADALDNIDTARQNLGEINKVVSQLPAGAPGSVIGSVRNFIGGKVNQLETMAPGFNPELQTLGTNIDASVQAGRAVAGSKGLRLNKDLIAVMFKNNTPQLTDSRAVAAEKLAKITKFLDDQEGTVLGTAHGVGTTPKVQKWGRDAAGNPVPLGQ